MDSAPDVPVSIRTMGWWGRFVPSDEADIAESSKQPSYEFGGILSMRIGRIHNTVS